MFMFALSGLMLTGALNKMTRTQTMLDETTKLATKVWVMRHKR